MIRNTAYYADKIAARYPDLPAKEIRKLCVTLMRRIYFNARADRDIRILSISHRLSLKIYKPQYSVKDHNERVQIQANYRWARRRIVACIEKRNKKKP